MSNIKYFFRNLINWTKFMYFIMRGTFGSTPESVLALMAKFIELEAPRWFSDIYMGRNVSKSCRLLQILVDSYRETKSEVVLNQILVVLKEEIIRRELKNGRKQF